jgi:hypothetical protein
MNATNAAGLAAAVLALALGACTGSDGSHWNPDPGPGPGDDTQPPDQCVTGDVLVRQCGNCGTTTSTCVGESWTPFSPCTGQGACAAGAQESAACGTDAGACTAGIRTRSCTAACAWEPWTACGGAYVGPTEEVCANGIDEDCDGEADELCSSIFVTGPIAKLVASPGGALLYGLKTGSPSQVVVLDVAAREEVARITLPQPAHDLDLSPNGQHLVVSHDVVHQISKIDLASNTVQMTKPVASDPYRLEVNDAGVVYYVEYDQWVDIRRVNASLDLASDTLLGSWALYAADLELSPDGAFLFAGEGGLSGSSLIKYDVSGGGLVKVDESVWEGGYGFPYPERHLYLGPDGQRAYYASHQLDADDLAFTVGRTEKILAEDEAGTLAVGTREVRDAQTLRGVGTLPRDAACATFANGDAELWYYHAGSGRVFWVPKADLGDAALGQRALAPEPLSGYVLSRLVRDPARPRLYGLDTSRDLVVAIDADTLQPTGAIVVGSAPTDLAISSAGDALFVGHFETLGVARIDLATFGFDGFVAVPRIPFEVEALSNGRLAIIDEDQWTTPTIIDPATGTVLASTPALTFEGALAASADGDTLFVGEAHLSGSNLVRYDVSGDTFVTASQTTYNDGYGFPYPARSVVAVPDGTGVYYAGFLLHGENLAILRYAQSDPIRTVTPDGRLAFSTTSAYRVSDGALLGTLPVSGSVQAVSPDGATLYVSTPGAIATVDLGAY